MFFNPKKPTIIHIDLNSCFATIEQQANPHLRGKPVAVAAYTGPSGCIVAPSVEAKKLGIKVGMRVKEGKMICPGLVILAPDPWKYRNVHRSLRKIISDYTDNFSPKSIDEFVLQLEGYPVMKQMSIEEICIQIKKRIRKDIGEWLSVSIGISTNRFLAKLAAGLHKPDGLERMDKSNFKKIYSQLSLADLPGIKAKNASRLNYFGIHSVIDFYQAPVWKLKAAFASINGYYWYLRLKGWEIDDVVFGRHSYGNSYALPQAYSDSARLSPILTKLVEKMCSRMRAAGYKTSGVHLAVIYRDGNYWHKGVGLPKALFDSRDVYKKAYKLLLLSPYSGPVRELAVSCFNLSKQESLQLDLFENVPKKQDLVRAVDKVNKRWGSFVITPGRMLGMQDAVPDRVAFGGVKELEEFVRGF